MIERARVHRGARRWSERRGSNDGRARGVDASAHRDYSTWMIQAFDHLHVYAADPEASIAFYRDVLGAEALGSIGTYVLPARLKPASRALAIMNRGIHLARRAITSALLRRVR